MAMFVGIPCQGFGKGLNTLAGFLSDGKFVDVDVEAKQG